MVEYNTKKSEDVYKLEEEVNKGQGLVLIVDESGEEMIAYDSFTGIPLHPEDLRDYSLKYQY